MPDSKTFVTSGVADLLDAEDTPHQGTIMTWVLPCQSIRRDAERTLSAWAMATDVEIDQVFVSSYSGGRQEIEIFYKSDEALEQFEQDGTSARLEREAISAVQSLGYYEAYTSDWQVRFLSFDYILENYQGSYQLYYQR